MIDHAMTSSDMAMFSQSSSTSEVESLEIAGSPETDEEESGEKTPPKKKRKYLCLFRKSYSQQYPWCTESKKGDSYAFCMSCSRDVSLGKGGTKDLRKHESTVIHSKATAGCSGIKPLTAYCSRSNSQMVVSAAVKFAYFLAEHYLSISVADHASKLFPAMFPDSETAKDLKCSRTKASAILQVVAQEVWKEISSNLKKTRFFSLQTDETTDISVTQQLALMVRFFDDCVGHVRCVFLYSCCRGSYCQSFVCCYSQ